MSNYVVVWNDTGKVYSERVLTMPYESFIEQQASLLKRNVVFEDLFTGTEPECSEWIKTHFKKYEI